MDYWWKVQFLDDEILTCETVAAEHNPISSIQTVFVRASTPAAAKEEARRVRNLSATRRRQLEHEANGKCRCGRSPVPGFKRCAI